MSLKRCGEKTEKGDLSISISSPIYVVQTLRQLLKKALSKYLMNILQK